MKPKTSKLAIALKLQLNQDEKALDHLDEEIAITRKVWLLLMNEFWGGTIPLFATLHFNMKKISSFICQRMGRIREGSPASVYMLNMHTINIAQAWQRSLLSEYWSWIVIDFGISENCKEERSYRLCLLMTAVSILRMSSICSEMKLAGITHQIRRVLISSFSLRCAKYKDSLTPFISIGLRPFLIRLWPSLGNMFSKRIATMWF